MALLLYNNKTNSNTTKKYQEWLHDIVRKGLAINYDAKPIPGSTIVWIETKLFGKWIKYEITEKILANKLIETSPTDFRIKPINIEKQLIKDYKTSHLCRRFRLFSFIIFRASRKPLIAVTKSNISTAINRSVGILAIIVALYIGYRQGVFDKKEKLTKETLVPIIKKDTLTTDSTSVIIDTTINL